MVKGKFCKTSKSLKLLWNWLWIWSNGLMVKSLGSQSKDPVFKTTGWLQVWHNLPRSMEWVAGTLIDFVVKSKLVPRKVNLVVPLNPWHSWTSSIKRVHKIFFLFKSFFLKKRTNLLCLLYQKVNIQNLYFCFWTQSQKVSGPLLRLPNTFKIFFLWWWITWSFLIP